MSCRILTVAFPFGLLLVLNVSAAPVARHAVPQSDGWSSLVLVARPAQSPEAQELQRLYKEGMEAYNKGDFPAALKAFQAGLEKVPALKNDRATAFFLNSLGAVYASLGQFEKALDYYQR